LFFAKCKIHVVILMRILRGVQFGMCTPVYTNSSQPEYTDPMASIGIRELRQTLATYMRRAQAGERIVITAGGEPVAQLGPLAGSDYGVTLSDLVARGAVVPPRRRGDFVPAEPLTVYASVRLDRALHEVRA